MFLQRKDYSVLAEFLPPKQEFVVAVRITPLQYKLYRYYLDHITGEDLSARFHGDSAGNVDPDGCFLSSASRGFYGDRYAGEDQRKPVQGFPGAQSNLEPSLVSAAQLGKKGLKKTHLDVFVCL